MLSPTVTENEGETEKESEILCLKVWGAIAWSQFRFYLLRAEHHLTRTPVIEKQMCFPLHSYPVNNMVTGYISIDALEKFLGELHDFTPGSSGYLAYHIQDEINMSAIKNKLRRKLS